MVLLLFYINSKIILYWRKIYKNDKKIIVFGIILIFISAFTACKKDNSTDEIINLENMKTALTNAGYTIIENNDPLPKNSIGGFMFIFNGAHGNVNIPVLEFQNKTAADEYAKYINADENFAAIVNDKFLTIAEAHHGVVHANEKIFFENLINGKSIK